MAYSPLMVQPMRDEVTRLGLAELRTGEAVDDFLADRAGWALVFVNSVCGCAAGNARPALYLATQDPACPARRATVFAGQDVEATARLRSRFPELPPSSPCFLVLQGGEVRAHVPRHGIEGRTAEQIARVLRAAFPDAAAVAD
ncbi:MAG TPA: BrxA/BrxB family bacilliredoxin [Candidatus Krumholzibacteria bacterium]|nr:BrxA/BrxB family bacilliredoxin [Candidatus Krumholzibacteria bacterium]HPD72696.1 BrxA/BrxB family bacilliredoxin [Candidatus Krumholzibacteria bacterium]HRY40372.1 BrxA/BrxB family bacilliredoxin [Candidatus Krumholzibacteria bacterium]